METLLRGEHSMLIEIVMRGMACGPLMPFTLKVSARKMCSDASRWIPRKYRRSVYVTIFKIYKNPCVMKTLDEVREMARDVHAVKGAQQDSISQPSDTV